MSNRSDVASAAGFTRRPSAEREIGLTENRIIGISTWAEYIREMIFRLGARRSTVLIMGPSGTGKELIARAVHAFSPRAAKPLVVVDCTAIPPALFASQLFGHVKGAFSGATCDTAGCFRTADGGTVFLDEIGELSLDLQAQLLRVIEQRVVRPVGSCREIPVDVRVLAATNRQLAREVDAGRFRLDLFYRLNVVQLQTVPLCQRPEDIPPLCRHFLARLAIDNGLPQKRLLPEALDLLASLPWPGNVRQLHNVLERVVVLDDLEEITPAQLRAVLESNVEQGVAGSAGPIVTRSVNEGSMPRSVSENSAIVTRSVSEGSEAHPAPALRFASWPTIADCEAQLIRETLQHTSNNQIEAAQLLGVNWRVLARKRRKHGIALGCR
jgi:DNA-binding NtrC family response regulator